MLTSHIAFDDGRFALLLLDQRLLPTKEETFACRTLADVIYALQTMVIRGAPAIGVTAAYGCAIAAHELVPNSPVWRDDLTARLDTLAQARPTAVNLRWAVDIMRALWQDNPGLELPALTQLWLAKAKSMHAEDVAINRRMGDNGANLIDDCDTVMTHCNAGALATAGWGTALGVIYSAVVQGKRVKVIANETRPFLQGARLTAWELHKSGVPVTVACDNACSLLMRKGLVQKVVVGADRIAANGDTANKIGTCGVALLAKHFNIPFYVAAPASTFDLTTPDGSLIPIEDRTPLEVTHIGTTQITPSNVPVFNFAFDVTPAELIAGIVTERGILRHPYTESIAQVIGGKL